VYYEPNIAAAQTGKRPFTRAALVGGLLSLVLWSMIVAIGASLISH
jgi:hypothetical protein